MRRHIHKAALVIGAVGSLNLIPFVVSLALLGEFMREQGVANYRRLGHAVYKRCVDDWTTHCSIIELYQKASVSLFVSTLFIAFLHKVATEDGDKQGSLLAALIFIPLVIMFAHFYRS